MANTDGPHALQSQSSLGLGNIDPERRSRRPDPQYRTVRHSKHDTMNRTSLEAWSTMELARFATRDTENVDGRHFTILLSINGRKAEGSGLGGGGSRIVIEPWGIESHNCDRRPIALYIIILSLQSSQEA